MKRILLAIGVTVFSLTATAQLLTVNPAFPKDTDAFTITVDAAKGNRGLFNYANTNDVYVHIGLITSASADSSDWKYSKFGWGTTTADAKATFIGNNRWQYSISNIRTFFGVNVGETVYRIAILFRNGSGSVVQRNSDGTDMYVEVFSAAVAGKFDEPSMQPTYKPVPEPISKQTGDRIPIRYIASKSSNLQLQFNNETPVTVNGATEIIDSPFVTATGLQRIIARAESGPETDADTIYFFVTVTAPLPDNVRDGINYEPGDTSVILVLYAPGKSNVSVIGDFNNWTNGQSNMYLNKTPDGNRFWIRITGLTPGTEYAYQYKVDDQLTVADPYTEKVLDPDDDPFISNTTYPNLKAYPAGKTSGNVSILQTDAPAYAWQVSNFARPDKRGLIIYELLVRDFLAAHDWNTLKDTLNYLQDLGINAIEIMPFNEFEGNESWGYNTSFYFAPDKYYGPKQTLKQLVDECHKRGIAVIMDLTLNHSFGQSPMVQLYFDNANNRPSTDNPWFNPAPRHAFNVGYDMNHESAATHYLVSRVTQHWLQEYKLDGFRFDLSKGFTQKNTCDANGNNCNVAEWGHYDAGRVAIWKGYYDSVQLHSSDAYVILEHFADNDEEMVLSDYGMLFWGNLNYNFNEATMGYLANSNFEYGLHTVRGWNNPNLVTFMESHDEERLMYKNIQYGNASGSYNIKNVATGLKRNEMAAAFCFMMPGPKMIWQFGEIGYDYSINHCPDGSINDNCRTGNKPIRWDYLQQANRKQLHNVYKQLFALRQHPAYRNGFYSNRVTQSLNGALKWMKLTTDTSNLLVVGNFDVIPATGNITFQSAGTWYDYLSNQTITATGATQSVTLQPGEYHVYINRNLNGVPTPVSSIGNTADQISLKVLPNPVIKNAVIEYELPVSTSITISLQDMTGRRLAIVYAGFKTKGTHRTGLSQPLTLSHGTYLVQLQYGNASIIRKFIVR